MSSRKTRRSGRRRPIAFGALFLLALGLLTLAASLNPAQGQGGNTLLLASPNHAERGVFSAQVRSTDAGVAGAPELVFMGQTSIVAAVPPVTVTPQVLGAIIGEASLDIRSNKEILHYIVEEGDTPDGVAARFDVSANTLLWANDLPAESSLNPGDELIILPVSGALHLVRPADTLSEIAVWYRADMDEILDFNDLESAENVFVGDFLVIPGGRKPAVLPNGRLTMIANSYFIYPVPRSFKLTQGLHAFNAVDLGNSGCGGPVYAAAGGTVQRVAWSGTAGNYVRILHPNGVVTFYGHLSGQAVTPGAKVLQGQTIGYVGHTGYTIPAGPGGCHLHFEVRGASNPFVNR